jgi:hypothetical protein
MVVSVYSNLTVTLTRYVKIFALYVVVNCGSLGRLGYFANKPGAYEPRLPSYRHAEDLLPITQNNTVASLPAHMVVLGKDA